MDITFIYRGIIKMIKVFQFLDKYCVVWIWIKYEWLSQSLCNIEVRLDSMSYTSPSAAARSSQYINTDSQGTAIFCTTAQILTHPHESSFICYLLEQQIDFPLKWKILYHISIILSLSVMSSY